MNRREFAKTAYVVVVSLGLVFLLARWFNGEGAVDPLRAAQNSRIRFQTSGEASRSYSNLTPNEISLAESVLEKQRHVDGTHTELLYVGNSQTIAVMDQAPGDMISPQWLQVFLARSNAHQDVQVNVGSLPNLSAPELLIRLVAAGEASPRQVDVLVASVVLEEFRGLGVRDEVAAEGNAETVKTRIRSLVEQNGDLTSVSTSLQSLLKSNSSSSINLTSSQADSSFAKRLETNLENFAERSSLFAKRDDMRVQVSLGFHECRNRLLGITSSSARPVPEASYRASLELLELAFRYARAKNIKVLVYLAPIRPVQPNPNLPADVAKFRRDVPELCNRYAIKCLDYVDLIPENLWTNYPDDATGSGGQRDFAHFTGAGHKLLAEKLVTDMDDQLNLISQHRTQSGWQ